MSDRRWGHFPGENPTGFTPRTAQSTAQSRRFAPWAGYQLGSALCVQPRCCPHVGIHQACVDVAFGLRDHGVGGNGCGVVGLVPFVRQCQVIAKICRRRRLSSDGAALLRFQGLRGHGERRSQARQADPLTRCQASRTACLAASHSRRDAPRLAAQLCDISGSASSKVRPGYWPDERTPKP